MEIMLQDRMVSLWHFFYFYFIFQTCSHILKLDTMDLFQNFLAQAVFKKSLNATFLTLIPKKVEAMEVRYFRPISLVGGVYKINSMVLANRPRKVLLGIILESQNANVTNKQILDSVFIANECLDSRLKTGVLAVLCKLDVEKAYDHVCWDFLMYMLQRCEFSKRWKKWIMFCISNIRFSILINGSPTDFFGSTRGLRQVGPLSLMLFGILVEALSRMLDTMVNDGHLSSFSIGTTPTLQ